MESYSEKAKETEEQKLIDLLYSIQCFLEDIAGDKKLNLSSMDRADLNNLLDQLENYI